MATIAFEIAAATCPFEVVPAMPDRTRSGVAFTPRAPRQQSRLRARARGGMSKPELAPDDLAHDLVAAAADRAQARVPQRALDLVFTHVAVAAEQLDDVVRGAQAVALGEQLGHRRLAQRVLS